MDINRENLDTIFRGLSSQFRGAFAVKGEDEVVNQFVTEVPSSTASERFDWLGDLPDAREWLGPRILHQMSSHKYEVFHKEYEVTCRVQAKDIEDDRIGIYDLQAVAGGQAMRLLKPKLVTRALQAGNSQLCYDGQYFFDTDHPVGNDGDLASVSNFIDAGGAGAAHPWYLIDTNRVVKPVLFTNRKKPVFQALKDYSNLHTFMHREFLFGADCRYGTGYGLWQTALRCESALNHTTLTAGWDAMVAYKSDEKDEDGNRKKLGIRPNILVVDDFNLAAATVLMEAQYLNSLTDPFAIGSSTTVNPLRNRFKVVNISWL